jgi:uncharacterized phage-associated protein
MLNAHDVAVQLRRRLPGVGAKKLHKLLYYCQGHHLAAFDEPLFSETISAWNMGPVVGALWHKEREGDRPMGEARPTEAQLNTIGYVVSRYGALTGRDLENLTHSEQPWVIANASRLPNGSTRIELAWIRDYFMTYGMDDAEDEMPFDSTAVKELLQGAEHRRDEPRQPDDLDEIRSRLGIRV